MHGVLALTLRALRLDTRTAMLHWLRIGLAVVFLLALLGIQVTGGAFGAPGLRLYLAVVEIDFWFVSVLGSAVFASVLAEEREQGGLQLMRLAGIDALSIVLGKSIGQLVTALSLLAVQLPFALLAVALGGVDHRQVLAGFAVLGGYLLFCYGAGLLFSAACRTVGAAARRTAAVLALASIWPLVVDALVALGWIGGDAGWAWDLSPYRALAATGQGRYGGVPSAAPVLAVAGAVAFLATWLCYDRFERAIERRTERRRTLLGWDIWGGSRRVPRWSASALYWKDYRVFVGGRRGMVLRVLAYVGGAAALMVWTQPWRGAGARKEFGVLLVALAVGGIVVDLGTLAARVFRDEARDGTYSSLLMLPKTVVQLATGKIGGCLVVVFPALPWLVLSLFMDPKLAFWVGGPPMLWFLANLYLLLHLIVFASFFLARGAFALTTLGYVMVVGGGSLLVEIFGGIGLVTVTHICLPILCLVAAGRLRKQIRARLAELSW